MGRLTEFFRAGFNEKQVNALKTITSYPYISPAGDGKVFYVDPGASASGSGSTPETAFATLAEGIAAATTGRGDIILCLPGTETITTTPVTVDKAGLTIASVPHMSGMQRASNRYTLYNSTADKGCLKITKQCQILNINLKQGAYSASDAVYVVEIQTACTGTVIDGCNFVGNTVAHHIGIGITGASSGYNIIRNNIFTTLLKGVEFVHATDSVADVIENNEFNACGDGAALTGAGIFFTEAATSLTISGNTFKPCTVAGYPAINFNTNKWPTNGCYITGNTFVGESLVTCVASVASATYALLLAQGVHFADNKFRRSNTDIADGWSLTTTTAKAANGTVALFNVSIAGLVEAKIFGKVTTALTTDGATKTLVVGTAGATSSFVNVTDATTNSTIGDVVAGTSAAAESAALPDSILASGAAAAVTAISSTGGANVTGGTITWYCMWRPIIAGSTVVAA